MTLEDGTLNSACTTFKDVCDDNDDLYQAKEDDMDEITMRCEELLKADEVDIMSMATNIETRDIHNSNSKT